MSTEDQKDRFFLFSQERYKRPEAFVLANFFFTHNTHTPFDSSIVSRLFQQTREMKRAFETQEKAYTRELQSVGQLIGQDCLALIVAYVKLWTIGEGLLENPTVMVGEKGDAFSC